MLAVCSALAPVHCLLWVVALPRACDCRITSGEMLSCQFCCKRMPATTQTNHVPHKRVTLQLRSLKPA